MIHNALYKCCFIIIIKVALHVLIMAGYCVIYVFGVSLISQLLEYYQFNIIFLL